MGSALVCFTDELLQERTRSPEQGTGSWHLSFFFLSPAADLLSDPGEMTSRFHLSSLLCETGTRHCFCLIGDGMAQLISMC